LKRVPVQAIGLASLFSLLLPAAARPSGETVNVALPTLPPGKQVVIRFSATVNLPFPIGDTEVSTQGLVTASNLPGVVASDDPDAPGLSDPTITPIDAAPDLVITKSNGVSAVAPGSTTAYALGVTNVGDQAAAMVVVSDTVPVDTTFNAALSTPGWSCPDGSIAGTICTFAVGTVPVSAMSISITFAVNVSATPVGTDIANTATVADNGANGPDRNPLDNSATDTDMLDAPDADLSVTKTDNRTQVIAGATSTYTITVSNAGPDNAVGARVTDTPPATLTGVTWTCTPSAGASCSASGSDEIDDLVDLPVGESVVYTLTGTVDAGATGNIANTASVAAPPGTADPDTGNNSATDTDTIGQRAASGDFNGDGRSDVVFYNTATGEVREWWMDGLAMGSEVPVGTQANLAARIVGTGDYDGNGLSDLLWQDQTTYAVELWLNGTTMGGPPLPPPPFASPVVGSGDYDGDGTSDILWLDLGTQEIVLWVMSGGGVATSQAKGTLNANRSIRASEDYNNDGTSDLFILRSVTGMTRVRFMHGLNPSTQQDTGIAATPGWDVVGTGRYDDDGYADVLWHDAGFASPELWTLNGATVESRGPLSRIIRGRAEVVGAGDYDGDGHADILWLDEDAGGLRVWLLDGNNVTAADRLGPPPSPADGWIVVKVR
jgi:uncharacterized repeat protein (TIGR01451 family)